MSDLKKVEDNIVYKLIVLDFVKDKYDWNEM
jgi:hypothetical protein